MTPATGPTARPSGRFVAAVTLVVAALSVGGCRAASPGPPPDLGETAVVASDEPAAVEMDHVTAGWPAGLGRGLVRGGEAIVMWPFGLGTAPARPVELKKDIVVNTLEAVTLPLTIVEAVIGIAMAKAVAVAYVPVSVVGGAVTTIPTDEADAAERTLVAIAQSPRNPDQLAASIAEELRRNGSAPVALDSAETVLEVRLVAVGRGRWRNWWTLDRPFGIGVVGRVRAVRRSDGVVVWERTRTVGEDGSAWSQFPPDDGAYPRRGYLQWAQDGGAQFRAELDRLIDALAVQFVADLRAPPSPDSGDLVR